jgi:hypothetical protein
MLKGRQFFAWEILPVLQAANAYACSQFIGNLDSDNPPADQAVWRKACGDTAAIMVEANQRSDNDAMGIASSYKETSLWWQQVEWALSPFENVPAVVAAVAALPIDAAPLPGPSWTFPVAIGLGAFAILGLGYWWTVRKS